jgi:hypothetical protein
MDKLEILPVKVFHTVAPDVLDMNTNRTLLYIV